MAINHLRTYPPAYPPAIVPLSGQSLPSLSKRRLDYLASLESRWDIKRNDIPRRSLAPLRGLSYSNSSDRLYVSRAPELKHSREKLVSIVKTPDLKPPSLHYEEKAFCNIRYFGKIDEERGLLKKGATKYFVDPHGKGFNRHETNRDIALDTLTELPTWEALDIKNLSIRTKNVSVGA